jgi:DNA methylase
MTRKKKASIKRPLAYEPRHALNAICPYFTMFPLEYPLRVLKKHKEAAPVVMDPFCGRGTTLYAARILGLKARGMDSSPIAVAIAQAKLAQVESQAVLNLARKLITADKVGEIPDSSFFRKAFHRKTLRAICAIRHGLIHGGDASDAAVLLRAVMLGCLHGPVAKRPQAQAYFSNQMPRTFASKPDYSVRYWKLRSLTAPHVDVLAVLGRRLSRLQAPSLLESQSAADARFCDSTLPSSLPTAGRDFSVVVTSPPYFRMRTYVEDQWLRNWFLGGPDHVTYAESEQLNHADRHSFTESLGEVWKNMARTRAGRLDMYVRFGVIPSAHMDPKEMILESLEASEVEWRCVSTRVAGTAEENRRQAAQMWAESSADLEYDFHVVAA